MEPPLKRLRLNLSSSGDEDDEDQDELSMTPAQFDTTQDPMYQLDKGRAKAATRLKSTFEDIFEKYGKDFDGDDDVINFYTDEIEIDNGHLKSLENRKDNNAEHSLSADEEERILSGKSGGRQKKPPSKSLIPTNYTGHTQRLQFQSPWNESPRFNAPRLSSLAFSSYGSPPAFDLGRFTFRNSHVDPVWQAPDLPFQPQYRPLIGIGESQTGSFGGQSGYVTRRLVSAKSFLRSTSTPSQARNVDVADEEDSVILGRSRQQKAPLASLEDGQKVGVASNSTTGLRLSAPNSNQLPPFFGIGLDDDELRLELDVTTKELEKIVTKPSALDASVAEKSTNEDKAVRHDQRLSSPHNRLSPTRYKRRPPRNSDTRGSPHAPEKVSTSQVRALQPNERRIEIVIPIMKALLPSATRQSTEDPAALLVDESLQRPGQDQDVSDDQIIENTNSQDSFHDIQLTGHSGDAVHQSSKGVNEEVQGDYAKHTTHSLESQQALQKHSKRIQERIDPSNVETSPQGRKSSEDICIEATQESSSFQTPQDGFTDNTPKEDSCEIGQKLDCDREHGSITTEQQLSQDTNIDMGDEPVMLNLDVEESLKSIHAIEHNPKGVLTQSVSPKKTVGNDTLDVTIDLIDSSPMGTAALGTTQNQDKQIAIPKNQTTADDEPEFSRIEVNGVLDISEIAESCESRDSASEHNVGDIGPQYSEHSVVSDRTESDESPGRDSLSPNLEAYEIPDDDEQNAFDDPVCPSDLGLDAEINGLRLGSDHYDEHRSHTPGIVELPDQDLSVLPEADRTSEPVLPSSLSSITNDNQNVPEKGRSPSPELGTPIRSRFTNSAVSQTNTSPTPTTPTRNQGPKSVQRSNSYRRTPSSKRFPLTSLLPEGIDDESDDELSIAGSVSTTGSRLFSPFFRATPDHDLPPLLLTPRNRKRKHNLVTRTPGSSARTPNRSLGQGNMMPPATDSRTGRNQTRQERNPAVHSSPLSRRVAKHLLSSPTKRQQVTPLRRPSVVPSPNGTLRRCGEDGFECGREFCFTCCI
ncbi:hypothetical protein F5B22DRAFT_595065 [Xylaria bambusicola]|uniref:uncharacterized protein n=1 Tax=Xylaria bambusicola TaxID=326684 RepID=UPI002007ECF0|nr:uncharacterized protein F5B22DRAFT_595065 [Xylaria bambusicola]KAI0521460.1 hypothetical protein F5B22DRAFT_595065 [Xylaria bambusicola]